jgi:hypothetical protein
MKMRFIDRDGRDIKEPVTFTPNTLVAIPMKGDLIETGHSLPMRVAERTFTISTPIGSETAETVVALLMEWY